MQLLKLTVLLLSTIFVSSHTTKLCYKVGGSNVTFYACTDHQNLTKTNLTGGVYVDGVRYNFTSITNNVSKVPENATCIDCSINPYSDNEVFACQKVIVSGLTNGVHTLGTTCESHVDCQGCNFGTVNFTNIKEVCVSDNHAPELFCPKSIGISVNSTCYGKVPKAKSHVKLCDSCPDDVNITQSIDAGTYLPQGSYNLTVYATDSEGRTGSCNTTLNFHDNTPPTFQIIAVPSSLNGQYYSSCSLVDINIYAYISDNCCNTTFTITNIIVTDYCYSEGGDWEIVSNNLVRVRPYKNPYGNGRIYTISATGKDCHGCCVTATTQVRVF